MIALRKKLSPPIIPKLRFIFWNKWASPTLSAHHSKKSSASEFPKVGKNLRTREVDVNAFLGSASTRAAKRGLEGGVPNILSLSLVCVCSRQLARQILLHQSFHAKSRDPFIDSLNFFSLGGRPDYRGGSRAASSDVRRRLSSVSGCLMCRGGRNHIRLNYFSRNFSRVRNKREGRGVRANSYLNKRRALLNPICSELADKLKSRRSLRIYVWKNLSTTLRSDCQRVFCFSTITLSREMNLGA